MSETALKCSCCKTYRPIGWFDKDEGESHQDTKYSSCFVCRRKWRDWRTQRRAKQRELTISAIPEGYKYCPRCRSGRGAVLPIAKFSRNKRRQDGLDDRCRSCQNALNARRRVTRAESRTVVNPCLQDVLKLTPQDVQDRLAAGLITDQVAGYWMKPTLDDRPPCWKEVRDYTNAWNRIFAKKEATSEAACQGTSAQPTTA